MRLPTRPAGLLPLLLTAWVAAWLPTARAQAPAGAAPAPAAAPASAPSRPAPRAHVTVIEDEQVRIEEMRGRDGVRRVVVQNKGSTLRPYEIQVAPAGRDPSQEKGSAGKRTWSLFDW